jgi:AcrR family transcriptional regulator
MHIHNGIAMSVKLDTQVRQEQIAQAALDVIASHGLSGLNVGAVARRVGIVPSAIYRHFENMDQVLDAVLDMIGRKLLDNAAVASNETDNAIEQLKRLLDRHMTLIRQNEAMPRVVFSAGIYTTDTKRRQRMYDIIQQYLLRIAHIVRDGQASGHIRAEMDPDIVAVMFLGLIQPSAILWHVSDGRFDVTRQTKKAWPVFKRAIAATALRTNR